ncbi:phosphate transporter PHO1 10 [Artemisia annua]|uniref:Phosphate transporter PHO1 10 n=1 Tax=Artemisia annua TaxID=35608 RepID=A0A2U1KBN7_ARTAN|nr:phosphate transporter PHO1 10 [Artemisia annua]
MKFGKEFKKQKVPEWIEAYVDYNGLKRWCRTCSTQLVRTDSQSSGVAPECESSSGSLKRRRPGICEVECAQPTCSQFNQRVARECESSSGSLKRRRPGNESEFQVAGAVAFRNRKLAIPAKTSPIFQKPYLKWF